MVEHFQTGKLTLVPNVWINRIKIPPQSEDPHRSCQRSKGAESDNQRCLVVMENSIQLRCTRVFGMGRFGLRGADLGFV